MNATRDAHPSLESLIAFDRGRLPSPEQEAIERHVLACDRCSRQLERLGDDSFVSSLRGNCPSPLPAASTPAERDVSAATPCPGARPLSPPVVGKPPADSPRLPAALVEHPRYRVIKKVGEGGMGAVYQAEHRRMNCFVALKVIHERFLANPAALERFKRETRAAAGLSHPNIVRALDADQAGDTHFLVLEFVKGTDLARYVSQKGRLPVALACHLARQAALGLQHAFELGMVHRDIKPSNMLVTAKGQLKIADFGLARFVREAVSGAALTGANDTLGTPDYLAPEQARDARTADIRSDIYSLGCTLYHLLAGQPPFPENDTFVKLAAHMLKQPTPLRELGVAVPEELQRVLDRMLAKDPAQRYQTPVEVAEALKPFIRQELARHSATAVDTAEPLQPCGSASRPLLATVFGRFIRGCAAAFSQRPAWQRRGLFAAGVALLGMLVLGYFNSAKIIRIATNKGELVIVVDDPKMEVIVKEDQAIILDSTGQRTINLAAGDHEIEVTVKDAGGESHCFTKKFTLNRGGKETLRVTQEPAQAKAQDQGTVALKPPADPNPGRRAAEWVLSIGGRIKVRMDGQERDLGAAKDLPEGHLEVTGVLLYRNRNIHDAGLVHLEELKNLTQLELCGTRVSDVGIIHLKCLKNLACLDLGGTMVSDAGLVHLIQLKGLHTLRLEGTQVRDTGLTYLAELKNLTLLNLSYTQLSDGGMIHLKELETLTWLHLGRTQVGDAGLARLTDLKNLKELYLHDTEVSDAALVHLMQLKNLTKLDLSRTRVTAAGVEQLQKSLRRCEIIWSARSSASESSK
jgi:hypothetical protein